MPSPTRARTASARRRGNAGFTSRRKERYRNAQGFRAKSKVFGLPLIPLLSNHLQLPQGTHQSTPLTRWNLYSAGVFNDYGKEVL